MRASRERASAVEKEADIFEKKKKKKGEKLCARGRSE